MSFEKIPLNINKDEDKTPEYKLGSLEKGANKELVNIAQMRFKCFKEEYLNIMNNVKEKEKKGKLDPHDESYVPMNKEEWGLMAKSWKDFSRGRGFSEEDIEEYGKWLILSGQKDDIPGAINDPWRRTGITVENLYLKHIEKALEDGLAVPGEVILDYNKIKNKEDNISIFDSQKKKDTEDFSYVETEDDDWS